MRIHLYKQQDDEAEEQLVESWGGDKSVHNIGYYIGKHIEENVSLRIQTYK